MDSTEKKVFKESLKAKGFKAIAENRNYFINPSGDVVNLITGKSLINNTRPELANIDGKHMHRAKLVLLTFCKEEYKPTKQISYKDGNRTNFDISNIGYIRQFSTKPEPINEADLLRAIRCYIEVKKKYRIRNTGLTKLYISHIVELRHWNIIDTDNFQIFREYLRTNTQTAAKIYNIQLMDCGVIINRLINRLINSILTDLFRGNLTVLPFIPRKKSKNQMVNEYLKHSQEFIKKLDTV